MSVIADACWFIDLEKRRPNAIEFLKGNPDERFVLTEIVRAELFAGGRDFERVAALVGGSDLLPINSTVAQRWGQNARLLRAAGQTIGANDLWIASIALTYDLPVLTRNGSEFERVAGIRVLAY